MIYVKEPTETLLKKRVSEQRENKIGRVYRPRSVGDNLIEVAKVFYSIVIYIMHDTECMQCLKHPSYKREVGITRL